MNDWHLPGVGDSYASWAFAIAALREIRVRRGEYEPRSDDERRWASEGPREPHELDTVRA